MQTDVHKTLHPFYTTKKMPHVMQQSQKMGFVVSHSQVYYDNFLHRLSTDFQNRVLFHKSIAITTNETTNYDFILPSKTC